MKGSYQINDSIISGNISNHQDSNVKLKYVLFGRKYIRNPPTVTVGPEQHYNKSTGEWEAIEKTETQKTVKGLILIVNQNCRHYHQYILT
jgi:hypothetical protein